MAKDEKGGKIRVVVFELEGSNETLQESLRTVANALGRTIVPQRIPASAPQQTLPKNGKSKTAGTELPTTEEAEFEVDEEDEKPSVPARKKRNNPPRQLQVVDIEFNAGTIPFEDFCNQKNPDTDVSKYLVCTLWLKENAKIDSVNPDHIYTCYKRMKWKVPKDPGGAFRTGKRAESGYYRSSAEKGHYSITHIGENVVNKMNA
jgi:hypothetical protein